MQRGTVVWNIHTQLKGIVVDDPIGMCKECEVPVVYQGNPCMRYTKIDDLENKGIENPIADIAKCGGGQKDKCCIFIVMGSNGFECQRFGDLRYAIIARKSSMNAQREPIEMYPDCQID